MRRRLIIVAAAISVMVALAFLVPLIVLVRTVARDRAITAAEHDAATLSPVLSLALDSASLTLAVHNTDAGADGRMTVVLPSGEQVGAAVESDDELALARRGTSFEANHSNGTAVYTAVTTSTGTTVVRVWVPDALLTKGVTKATWSLIGLAVVLVVVAIIVSDRLGASMVKPVRRLAHAAERLAAGDLDQRVVPEGPAEVAALAHAFNLLADRVGELLAAERELVADLSHRLRTPLTVLRVEADAVPDPESRERVSAAAVDLEDAVTALIAEARRPITSDVGTATDIVAVTKDRVDFWSALAEDQGRAVDADLVDEPVLVRATAGELEAAVDAVLGNVFEHTPDGSPFAVSLRRSNEHHVVLCVDDAGPGVDEGVVARGHSSRGSTGLGLDIVRRTVESAGGELSITRSELGGASISLTFPSSSR